MTLSSMTDDTAAGAATLGREQAPAARVSGARAVGARVHRVTLAAAVAWLASAGLTAFWPNAVEWDFTTEFAVLKLAVAVVLLGLAVTGTAGRFGGAVFGAAVGRFRKAGAWFVALAVGFTAWELATAKIPVLPRPFFAPPQALLGVYVEEWPRLLECVVASLVLLVTGVVIGAVMGFVTGVGLGWSRIVGYWVHPVLRLIGPLPPVAWLPVAFFSFPSSQAASIFLIALATGVPTAILTWSGVASVNTTYYDIARTMGASNRFLVLRVAIPAAMPHVYVGLFMGMAASFAVLVVAEMLGVKAGLGWYLQWALGWAAYSNMYAALLIMALMCSGLVTLLFKIRDRHLAWQKGLVKW